MMLLTQRNARVARRSAPRFDSKFQQSTVWRKPFDVFMKVAENDIGGGYRDRTGDLQTASLTLSQLS
jgi:hypothetical protein